MELKLIDGANVPFLIATPDASYCWQPGESQRVPKELGLILVDRYPKLFKEVCRKTTGKQYSRQKMERKA